MRIWIILMLTSASMAFSSQDDAPFSSSSRQNYLEREIMALREISDKTLKDISEIVESSEKQKCRSLFEPLTLKCLLSEADTYCRRSGPKCLLLWDVVIVNKMNEKFYISKDEKFKISENAANFPQAYSKALSTKHALLVTQMLLFTKNKCIDNHPTCLAESIDLFCLNNANTKGISWQACASALVWFINGGDGRT